MVYCDTHDDDNDISDISDKSGASDITNIDDINGNDKMAGMMKRLQNGRTDGRPAMRALFLN